MFEWHPLQHSSTKLHFTCRRYLQSDAGGPRLTFPTLRAWILLELSLTISSAFPDVVLVLQKARSISLYPRLLMYRFYIRLLDNKIKQLGHDSLLMNLMQGQSELLVFHFRTRVGRYFRGRRRLQESWQSLSNHSQKKSQNIADLYQSFGPMNKLVLKNPCALQ